MKTQSSIHHATHILSILIVIILKCMHIIKNNTQIKLCHHVIENILTNKNNPDRTNSYR